MRVIGSARSILTFSLLLTILLSPSLAPATPPPDHLHALQRGIAITAWFRFPASPDPAALRAYLPDPVIEALHHTGFTFIRLPVQPEFLLATPNRLPLLISAIRRLQHAGLAVVVDAHPATWHLETSGSDRSALRAFWQMLAPALRPLDPRLTYPELLNEPVFPNAPDQWQALQASLFHAVRTVLSQDTIVLTGNDWGSIAGLIALHPVADDNVVYSFHFYQPPELTSLAAYRPGLDRGVLARLPFPGDTPDCTDVATGADPQTAGVVHFYCALHWNAARIAAEIGKAEDWGRRNHAAVLLGEFGASTALAPAARDAWLHAVRSTCETDGIGWALWGYDDVMGLNLPRPPAAHPRLDPDLLRALFR